MFKLFSGSLFQKTAPVDPGMDMPSCEFKPEPYEVKITFFFVLRIAIKLREIHEAQDYVNCRLEVQILNEDMVDREKEDRKTVQLPYLF